MKQVRVSFGTSPTRLATDPLDADTRPRTARYPMLLQLGSIAMRVGAAYDYAAHVLMLSSSAYRTEQPMPIT